MSTIDVKITCVLTVVVGSDDDEATAADLGRWVNENHGNVRSAIESGVRMRTDNPRIGYLDANHSVHLMDIVEVDARIPKAWGVATLEWSES